MRLVMRLQSFHSEDFVSFATIQHRKDFARRERSPEKLSNAVEQQDLHSLAQLSSAAKTSQETRNTAARCQVLKMTGWGHPLGSCFGEKERKEIPFESEALPCRVR